MGFFLEQLLMITYSGMLTIIISVVVGCHSPERLMTMMKMNGACSESVPPTTININNWEMGSLDAYLDAYCRELNTRVY